MKTMLRRILSCVIIIALFVLITWIVLIGPQIVQFAMERNGVLGSDVGSFGDQYGVVNALFSGLAFAGVIVALIMQMIELRQQRAEIDDTQEIMGRQQASMERQNFDSMFFKTLELLRAQRDSVGGNIEWHTPDGLKMADLKYEGPGVNAFFKLAKELRLTRGQLGGGVADTASMYADFYRQNLYDSLGAYMRILYRIVRLLADSSEAACELGREKSGHLEDYAKILRAQLSSSELVVIFYNCESEYGANLKPFTESLNLFDNLDPQLLADPADASANRSSFFGVPSTI